LGTTKIVRIYILLIEFFSPHKIEKSFRLNVTKAEAVTSVSQKNKQAKTAERDRKCLT
jgi:hypothetical protein